MYCEARCLFQEEFCHECIHLPRGMLYVIQVVCLEKFMEMCYVWGLLGLVLNI